MLALTRVAHGASFQAYFRVTTLMRRKKVLSFGPARPFFGEIALLKKKFKNSNNNFDTAVLFVVFLFYPT